MSSPLRGHAGCLLTVFSFVLLCTQAQAEDYQYPAYYTSPRPAYTPDTGTAGYNQPAPVVLRGGSRDTSGRINIMEENDYFVSNDDRHYTQGARVSYLSRPVTSGGFWDEPFIGIHDLLPFVYDGTDRKRKWEYTVVGQSIFTPTAVEKANPGPKARPYAAWLYTGASLLQDTKQTDNIHSLENTELLAGVVGPEALGALTQNSFHQFIGESASLGWNNQIHTEPGVMATYERKYRFELPVAGSFGFDAIPEAGVTAGNVMTYGEISGIVRIGQNLAADYGVDRIRPSLSGTGWFDPDQMKGDFGWYAYAGTQGRAVAQNIFLDGNTIQSSVHVNKRPLVADLDAGASLFWSNAVKVDFTYTLRTKEFYGQAGHPDHFGGLNLDFAL